MVANIYRAKLAIVGNQAVGKTAISQVFISNGSNYPTNYNMTFAAEVNSKVLNIPDTDDAVELLIYDSPGFEAYTEYLDRFWNKPDLLMIVFDVTNNKSFDSILYWYRRSCEAEWKTPDGNPLTTVLFANKTDCNRTSISMEQAKDVAEKNNMKLIAGSAKDNQGIDEAMKYLAEEYYNSVDKSTEHSLKKFSLLQGTSFLTSVQ